MKNTYQLLFLFLGLLFSNMSSAQLVSLGNVDMCETTGSVDLLTMLTLNGVTPTASQVTFTTLTSSHSDLFITGNTVIFGATLPSGVWTLSYQACETNNTANCVTANVTVRVVKPFISNVIQPTCNSNGTVILNGMPPSGVWQVTANGGIPITQGSSDVCVISDLTPGTVYTFTITSSDGCTVSITPTIIQPQPPPPTVTAQAQTCSSPSDSITLVNLPEGDWTLRYRAYNSIYNTINGSGTTYTLSGLTSYQYDISVINSLGCVSPEISVYIGYLQNSLYGTMTSAYVDYNNDGITNLGDIIQYTVTITNNLTCPMETVTYRIGSSNNPTGTLANLAAGATAAGTLNYPLTQDDINNGSVFNWIAVNGLSNGYDNYIKLFDQNQNVILTLPDGIKLNAFFDANNDGIQNNGEVNSNLGSFTYQLNNNGTNHYLYSQSGTNIIYESNPANTYTLSYNDYNNCTGGYGISATSYSNVTVPTGSGITTYNFPIAQSPCQDIQVSLFGWAPRPGFNYTNYITYRNIGNQTLTAGTITFTKDNAVIITSISEATAVTTATGFTYNFTNLLPNETRTIDVAMLVPTIPTVALGQLLTNSASITIPVNDINPSNNNTTLTQPIVGSYDPNDKKESHGGKIVYSGFTSNDYLTYMIRFENTGTASAINIKVNDLLDEKLDETSIKMIRASHPYVLDRMGKNLTWKFDGVNLPPSLPGNEIIGHGYLIFQVKPAAGFAVGDIIPNAASIYFDFNPAIVTNTCTTEFVPFLGTSLFDKDNLTYYPNPVKHNLHLSHDSVIDSAEVTSVLGQVLFTKEIHANEADIDLSGLSQGMYLISLKSKNQYKTIKVTKE